MVSTAPPLNHDQGVASPPQVERDAPPDRGARQAAAVDAEDAIAHLEADLRRAAAGAHGFDQRARPAGRAQVDAEQLLTELVAVTERLCSAPLRQTPSARRCPEVARSRCS